MKARRLTFILLAAVVLASPQATAKGFAFPVDLPGFERDIPGRLQDGPIYMMLKKDPYACDDVTDYGYSDSAAATAGLASYLKRMNMTSTELERTKTTVAWRAKSGYQELFGVWQANDSGGGRLELCALRPRHTLTSTSGGLTSNSSVGGYGFGGLGGLGLIMWFVRRRLLR